MWKIYKKDATVEAIQFNSKEYCDSDKYKELPISSDGTVFKLITLEGDHILREGDYICRGLDNEFWNVRSDIFENTYREVTEADKIFDKFKNTEDVFNNLRNKELSIMIEALEVLIDKKEEEQQVVENTIKTLDIENEETEYTAEWLIQEYSYSMDVCSQLISALERLR